MQCIKIVVTAAGNMKLLAIATTYILSSTQMYLQFPQAVVCLWRLYTTRVLVMDK